MIGVIYLWKVKRDKLTEHEAVMKATLGAEREHHPEILLNLTLGPANDGTCAEIQVFADEAVSATFHDHAREDAELQRLWARFGDLCEPDGWKTIRFERLDFLNESFIREMRSVTTFRDSAEPDRNDG